MSSKNKQYNHIVNIKTLAPTQSLCNHHAPQYRCNQNKIEHGCRGSRMHTDLMLHFLKNL